MVLIAGCLGSRGNEKDGTLRVAAASASVQVTLAPRASKIVLQKDSQTASDITVNSVTFADAASSVPYAHIEPQYYSEYENLPVVIRKTYSLIAEAIYENRLKPFTFSAEVKPTPLPKSFSWRVPALEVMMIQCCASGGGRANWGMLRGFDEFWVSGFVR